MSLKYLSPVGQGNNANITIFRTPSAGMSATVNAPKPQNQFSNLTVAGLLLGVLDIRARQFLLRSDAT